MFSRVLTSSPSTRRRLRRGIAGIVALAVVATIIQVADLPELVDPNAGRPEVSSTGDAAPALDAPDTLDRGTDQALDSSLEEAPAVNWPVAASTEVDLVAGDTASRAVSAKTTVGGLDVTITADEADDAPSRVRVETFDQETSEDADVDGPLLSVTRADGESDPAAVRVTINYSDFADAYGGDFGSRLTAVSVPECATSTPDDAACSPQEVESSNDTSADTLSAEVAVSSVVTLLAATATESSSQGDYSATGLSPSSSWSVSPSSGAFTWSYPLRLPPVPGGNAPSVTLGYSSQTVDGRTSTTNNQGSWLGEGFSYEPGYVERQYNTCQDDGHDEVGDLCWAYDNATIVLGGRSGQLVRDGDTWRFSSDDGSKIERLTGAVNGDNDGEYWKVTTTDGTQYFFGLNRLAGWAAGNEETASAWTVPVFGDDSGEPCYSATFADAHCQQAWRWNLDYVKDIRGNVMSYFYGQETNSYALGRKTDVAGTSYTRGGWLKRIDYGQRDGAVYTTNAPARVVFTTAERCIPTDTMACAEADLTTDTASAWPDVPFDRYCAASVVCADDQVSPTFWTRKRVTAITTQIRSGSDWQAVDAWDLEHLFVDNGDGSRSLWLHTITHRGEAGDGDAISMPSVQLDTLQLPNRIDLASDNIAPLIRPRLAIVYTDSGGQINVRYAAADCSADALPTPGSSVNRCYPVIWHPGGSGDPVTDWFHKYVVESVTETDRTAVADDTPMSPQMVTSYEYVGDAAWRHAEANGIEDPEYQTWSQWRGYATVRVRKGDEQTTTTLSEHTYLRGMNGDQSPGGGTRSITRTDSLGVSYVDEDQLAGFEIETVVYNGSDVVTKSTTSPWRYETASQTWSWGTDRAFLVLPETARTLTALSSGGWRETRTTTTYDPATATYLDPVGRVTQVEDAGDVSDPADDRCTRTSYADNTTLGIRDLVSEAETVAVACSVTPDRATQVLSHGRIWYDGLDFGASPTVGNPTRTEKLASHDGTTATYVTVAEGTFDVYGRVLTATDVAGSTTTTVYTETDGLATSKTVTSPQVPIKGVQTAFTATTEFAPAWGQTTAEIDWNGKRTDLTYDALGRVTAVWLADRSKSAGRTPNVKYTYTVDGNNPTSIMTEKIDNDGGYAAEYQIYDGFLRPRQTQVAGPEGGRLVADTLYTATGQVAQVNDTYYAAGAPSGQLLPSSGGDVDLQTRYAYDGLDRVTATITLVAGAERWRTTAVYGGDRTTVDPPEGGTPTTTIVDARDQTIELRQYHGDDPSGDYDATTYAYTAAGLLASMTDPVGNTWSYTYDQRGRKVAADDPDAGVSTLAYDDLDRVTSTTDARGITITTVYDALGRTTATYRGDAATGTKLASWTYDILYKGQLTYSSRYVDGQAYSVYTTGMDSLYRTTRTQYVIPADAGTTLKGVYDFTTSYNQDGTVQGMTTPAGGGLDIEAIVYTYDDLQQVTAVTGRFGSYAGGMLYSTTGQLLQMALNTGGKTAWVTDTYEKGTNRLTRSILNRQSTSTVARPNSDIDQTYTYDDAGNILSIADTPDTGDRDVQCLAYDHLQRLTSAWSTASTADDPCAGGIGVAEIGGPAPYSESYTYDPVGNRLTETSLVSGTTAGQATSTYTYPAAGSDQPHALQSVTESATTGQTLTTYAYDAAGNTTQKSVAGVDQDLTWDAEGHLATSTTSGQTTSYVYTADGDQILRREPGATTLYLPGMELRLDTTTATVTGTRYCQITDTALVVRTAGGTQFQIADHHGTGQAAIDATTGDLVYRRTTPFGTARGTTPSSDEWAGERGFVGGTEDATTGLTHLGVREYDPDTGRFISVDPILDLSDPQQSNAYAYANNSPVSYSDPSGEKFCSDSVCGPGADYVDTWGTYHEVPGHNDGCGGCSGAIDTTISNNTTTKTKTQIQIQKVQDDVDDAKQIVVDVAEELGKILLDELGITDALDCFTTGDLAACAATAVTVIASMIGGIGAKLIAKYGMRLNKIAKLIEHVKKLGEKLVDAVNKWIDKSKALKKAAEAVDDACPTCGPGGGLSQSALDDAFNAANTPEKLGHIIDPAKHGFDDIVEQAGGRSEAMREITDSLRCSCGLPTTGRFEVQRVIYGETVTIRGAIVNGVPRIGTAFVPSKFPGKP